MTKTDLESSDLLVKQLTLQLNEEDCAIWISLVKQYPKLMFTTHMTAASYAIRKSIKPRFLSSLFQVLWISALTMCCWSALTPIIGPIAALFIGSIPCTLIMKTSYETKVALENYKLNKLLKEKEKMEKKNDNVTRSNGS